MIFRIQATLRLEAFDLERKDFQWREDKAVVLGSNRSTELWSGSVPGQEIRHKESDVPRTIVISARLIDEDGTVLARYANWCANSVLVRCAILTLFFQAGTIQIYPLPFA